jgi:hypothetical protein
MQRNRFLFNNQPDTQVIQILFYHKTLHVLGIFSARHQEFSTVHLALVSFMQVFDDHFHGESGWKCSSIVTLLGIISVPGRLLKKKSDSRFFMFVPCINSIKALFIIPQ